MSTRRKRPSQQRSRATYDAILEAATRVFASEGMAATTNRIADEAGVSVGSLYQYFGDKYEILSELASRHVSAARERFAVCLADIAERELTPDEAVRLLVECAIEVNSNPRQFFHLLYDQVPRTPELIEQVEGMNRQLVLGFSEYLQSRGFLCGRCVVDVAVDCDCRGRPGASGCAGIGFTRRTSSANGSRRAAGEIDDRVGILIRCAEW